MKYLFIVALAIIAATLISATSVLAFNIPRAKAQDAQGDGSLASTAPQTPQAKDQAAAKQKKCNNVKIMAVITGLNTKSADGLVTLNGQATLQGQTVTKTITVNTTDTSEQDGIGLPLFFKKAFSPCPLLGTNFSGAVNSTTFSGALQSINRPNPVEVDLGGQISGQGSQMVLGESNSQESNSNNSDNQD